MSGSDRGRYVALISASIAAILIFCGTLFYTFHMGDLSGRRDADAQGYAASYPHDTSKQIAECWAKLDTRKAQECVAGAIKASHDAQRGEADLSAQRQMSDWAFWALIIAFISAAVTGIGTFLLYQQIILTRQAVEDTGNATNAMLEANEISRAQFRASYKPFLRIEIKGPLIDLSRVDNGQNSSNFSRLRAQIHLFNESDQRVTILAYSVGLVGDHAYPGPMRQRKRITLKCEGEHVYLTRGSNETAYPKGEDVDPQSEHTTHTQFGYMFVPPIDDDGGLMLRGFIEYIDVLNITRKMHFGFFAQGLRGEGYLEQGGGNRVNYEEIIDEGGGPLDGRQKSNGPS